MSTLQAVYYRGIDGSEPVRDSIDSWTLSVVRR